MSVTEIRSVKIFDGWGLSETKSVFFRDGEFVKPTTESKVIDGKGLALLPGLIDSHIHLSGKTNLGKASFYGVVGLMDMATQDPSVVDSLRNALDLPIIRSSYRAASPSDSHHAEKMGTPIIETAENARAFVKEQLNFGADYIKVVAPDRPDSSKFGVNTLRAVVDAAHESNKKVIVHAVTTAAYNFILGSGIDVVTHLPLNGVLTQAVAEKLAKEDIVCVPTLVMMEGMSKRLKFITKGKIDFKNSCESFKVLKEAGVRIIAGTDSNDDKKSPFQPIFGKALHHELKLLCDLGFSPIESIRSATEIAADFWGLTEMGKIAPGKRADFSLIGGDPTSNIKDLGKIRQVWIRGKQIR
jgi:imidazolonepropionase-like amidohydrolase